LEAQYALHARHRETRESPLTDVAEWLDDAFLDDLDDEPLVDATNSADLREAEFDGIVEDMNIGRLRHA